MKLRTRAGLAALPTSLALLTGGVAAAAEAPVTGAAVGSDPYLSPRGNGGYDVTNYDLRLRYDQRSHGIAAARVKITARALRPLSGLSLDAGPGLRIRSVAVAGHAVAHRHAGGKLLLSAVPAIGAGARFTVTVRYAGVPRPLRDQSGRGRYGWLRTPGGSVTFSEPTGTSAWVPSNDVFYDKATWSTTLTAPAGRTGVSTGRLVQRSVRGAVTRTRWLQPTPIQPYAQVVAFDRFAISTKPIAGLPAVTAVAKGSGVGVAAMRRRTATALRWLVPRLGPYPFAATGAIVVSGGNSAMETAGRPTYSPDPWNSSAATVLHEQAHQWYGNVVTARSAQDIWLHEGFATYLENVATAARDRHDLDDVVHGQYVTDGWGRRFHGQFGTVSLANPTSRYLLNTTPYYRGQAALHALRSELGEASFWRLLRLLPNRPAGGTTSTATLIARAEQISDRDLSAWAARWVYSTDAQSLPVAPSPRQVVREFADNLLNAASDYVWRPRGSALPALRKAARSYSPTSQLLVTDVRAVPRGSDTRYYVSFEAKQGPLFPQPYRSCLTFDRNDDAILAGAFLGVHFSPDFRRNTFTTAPCPV